MTKKAEAYWPLILLLAIIKFVLPLFLQSGYYELQRDEYLYYAQGQHLDFGFLENPSLISLLAGISSLFGGGEAWIKFWPCLFGSGTLILACLIAAELGGKIFAQFLAGLAIMCGAYMRANFLFQPVMLEIFCWTLSLYFLVRYIRNKDVASIYGLAFSLALGWWAKYSVLFLVVAVIFALLLTRQRTIFLRKHFWLAALLALIIISPNVWWQYNHNWPLIHHMKELRETQLQYVSPLEFLKDQLLMLFPVIFIWIGGLTYSIRWKELLPLAIVYITVIVLLMLGQGKSYYTLALYPAVLGAGAVAIEKLFTRLYWMRYVITAFILFISIRTIPILLPVWEPGRLAQFYREDSFGKVAGREWEDQQEHALPQDFADMTGWKELSQKAEQLYLTLPDTTRANTLIFCDNYGQAGALKYFGKDAIFQSSVISANGSFLLWMPHPLYFRHLIYVHAPEPDSDRRLFALFKDISVKDSVTNVYSRQFGNQVILLQNSIPGGDAMMSQVMEEMRSRFTRSE